MSLQTRALLQHLEILPSYHSIKVTVGRSMKAGAFVGTITALSGMIAGPLGLAAGGIIGSIIAGVYNSGEFKSLSYILIYEMTDREREQLADKIRNTLSLHHINTVYSYMQALEQSPDFQQIIVQILIAFLAETGRQVSM